MPRSRKGIPPLPGRAGAAPLFVGAWEGRRVSVAAETEAEPELTRLDWGSEQGSSPAQTIGPLSGWKRPSPEINASRVSLARGPQAGRTAGRRAEASQGLPSGPRRGA